MAIEDLIARLRATGEHETHPPADEAAVAQTEAALSMRLPPSFRAFVTQFSNGAYLFSLQEVSAVGAGGPQIDAIQDIARDGYPAEPGSEVPAGDGESVRADSLVAFSLDANGNCWCFLADRPSGDGEYEVAYCDTQGPRLVGRLASFETWLDTLIDGQDEVVRALGLADELGLG
jgi:hypothetical protein